MTFIRGQYHMKPSTNEIILKTTYLIFHLNLQGANDVNKNLCGGRSLTSYNDQ